MFGIEGKGLGCDLRWVIMVFVVIGRGLVIKRLSKEVYFFDKSYFERGKDGDSIFFLFRLVWLLFFI